jgi:hypothetical protein
MQLRHTEGIGGGKSLREEESADRNADFCFIQNPDDSILQTREE